MATAVDSGPPYGRLSMNTLRPDNTRVVRIAQSCLWLEQDLIIFCGRRVTDAGTQTYTYRHTDTITHAYT